MSDQRRVEKASYSMAGLMEQPPIERASDLLTLETVARLKVMSKKRLFPRDAQWANLNIPGISLLLSRSVREPSFRAMVDGSGFASSDPAVVQTTARKMARDVAAEIAKDPSKIEAMTASFRRGQ